MSATGPLPLRELLAQRYEDFKRRLTWRLGSVDLASDALHDTWVKLQDRDEKNGPVLNPAAYLMRMATNLALDRIERDRRYLSGDDADQLLHELIDTAPGPAQLADARDELHALAALIDELPPRRRAIFLAVRVQELSIPQAAARFGISTRLVGLELKRAHEHCLARMPGLAE